MMFSSYHTYKELTQVNILRFWWKNLKCCRTVPIRTELEIDKDVGLLFLDKEKELFHSRFCGDCIING